MNARLLKAVLLCFTLLGYTVAKAEDMDTELSKLAEKLATPIKEKGKKKVTVLDFTDLQGGGSELGKYIAEQLTVNLVMEKREFSVLDRANLKSIMAEHKLTATGLVDPENAKKLGQFAGVDALILGTITPKGTNINLTAKIITTDTAEIVGAAKAQFGTDETVQQLLSRAATASSPTGESEPPAKKPFADLNVIVESFKLSPGWSPYSLGRLTLIMTNTSASQTYGVALLQGFHDNFNFSNSRGEQFETTEVSGIGTAYDAVNRTFGTLTDIPPKSSITLVAKSQVRMDGKAGDYRPYRLSTIVYYGIESKGRYNDIKKYNLVMDIK